MPTSNGATALAPEKGGPMGSGTVGGLMVFCDYLINKGIATSSAVTPLKSAARQVFEIVEGTEDVDGMDVRSLNVEEYLDRFQVKAMGTGRYKPESIASYRSRFARIMEYYVNYLTTSEVPKFRLRGGGGSRKQPTSSAAGDAGRSQPTSPTTTPEAEEAESSTAGMISYPFPLQSGKLANLRLPVRLDRVDAERLGAFIRTLAFEPQKELDPGSDNEAEAEA